MPGKKCSVCGHRSKEVHKCAECGSFACVDCVATVGGRMYCFVCLVDEYDEDLPEEGGDP
jgi:hypothetical protein